ncbi:RCC1-like domain-containing protein [Hyalangium versicolor]|uniref:RCC1-like domain-containing protein n=1 Tax=Hyalangium versicolor TaxID=2861190 RepID=UPI001CCB476C|nr:RCC1 domain-containing protein [Hyalangium versicolor]
MEIKEFLSINDDFLIPGAPATTPDRQKAADAVRKIVKVAATQDTYFVKTNAEKNLYTCVLGWNHAIVLTKAGDHYVPGLVFCFGNNSGQKAYGAAPDLPLLERVDVDGLGGKHTWTLRTAPPLPLERLVTYGVSSCSFSVMYAEDLSLIGVSHLSGEPPIPLDGIFKLVHDDEVEPTKHFFASVLPQENEFQKFTRDRSLQGKEIETAVLLTRGMIPKEGSGAHLNPQMGHTEIGLAFTPEGPFCDGILGLEADLNYSRLLSTAQVSRLRAFASEDGIERNLLFSTSFNVPTVMSLAQVFADKGFPLSAGAALAAMERNEPRTWSLKDKGREYRIVTVIKDGALERITQYTYVEKVTLTGRVLKNGTIDDSQNALWMYLNSKNVDALKGREEPPDLTVKLGQDAVLTVVQKDRRWSIVQGDNTIEITRGAERSIRKKTKSLEFFCAEEARHIVEDVLKPLADGDFGFPAIHRAIFAGISNKLKQVRHFYYSRDAFLYYEYEVANGVQWGDTWQAGKATARMLGHFLCGESKTHPYAKAISDVIKVNRYEFKIPLGG